MRTKLKELAIRIGCGVFKVIRTPVKWYWKRFNVKTSGVRIMLVCKGELVLVRHWYNSLWVMPGGGIKRHEIPEQAAVRELREELGIEISQLDYALGTYSNTKEGKNDTVHCFVVEMDARPVIRKRFNLEVSDIAWYPFDKVPAGTSGATVRRIVEHLQGQKSSELRPW